MRSFLHGVDAGHLQHVEERNQRRDGYPRTQELFAMRRPKPQAIRNKLDLTDRSQVRLLRKRLGLSDAELTVIVGRMGNSIPAISKEAAQQRANALPKPADVAPAAVIASATAGEQTTAEVAATAPSS
ncbi:hypothetical protein ABIA43_005655 [Bradyrhizobium sp. USDA 328]